MSSATLGDIKRKFLEFITLKDAIVIDIVLGAVIANQFTNADSVNLYLIGPSSSAKTEILMSLQGDKRCYVLSSLTQNSFISGFRDAKNPRVAAEVSLLFKMKNEHKNILIFKDFTTVLALNKDSQSEIISQIRELVDGYFVKKVGNQPPIEWRGKLGFIMGVTPVIDRFHTIHSQLGERFLSYRLDTGSPDDWMSQSVAAFDSCGVETIIRPGLRDSVKAFLEKFESPDIFSIDFSKEIIERMHFLAEFVGRARAGVSRDHYHNVECIPEPERTPRLMKQFKSILAGIAIAEGKSRINYNLLKVIRKIARDSIPVHRDIIIKALWDNYYCATSKQGIGRGPLSLLVNIPYRTLINYLEDLTLLGIIEIVQPLSGANEVYRLTEFFEDVVARSEVYKTDESDDYDG
jgi:hypothetical protein